MALTNAEKQKRFRERQKLKSARPTASTEAPPVIRPFADFITSDELRVQALDTALDLLGAPAIDQVIGAEGAIEELKEIVGGPFGGAIMAVQTICALVSEYKIEQIDAKIRQIEEADLSDAEAKAKALTDIVRLHDLKKRFLRKDRYDFANMEVAGE